MNGGLVTFENCVFDSCDASPHNAGGGAGYVGLGLDTYHKSRAFFTQCVFLHNRAASPSKCGGALNGNAFGDMTIEACTFVGNQAGGGGAIGVGEQMQVRMTNCTFSGNWCGYLLGQGGALYSFDSSLYLPRTQITLDRTILAYSSRGAAVDFSGRPPVLDLNCCDVYGNAGGDWVGYIADQRGINGNIWGHPGFCDTLNGNFSIQATSPCMPDTLLGCGLIGAHGVGCSGDVWVVDPEGGGNFTTIQAALNGCDDWDVVELEDANFTGMGNRDISVPDIPVTIRSESDDPSACVIDCQGSSSNFHRAFTFTGGVGQESMLRGVGITGGVVAPDSGGGAIRCSNGSPRIAGCLLFRNDGGARGGGMACENGAFPALVRSTLSGNQADSGGGLYCAASSGALLQACILSFSAAGAAVGCGEDATPMLSCSDVYGNTGGDWVGCIQEQLGLRYSMNLDPCFCDVEEDDYTLHDDSPCAGDWYGCGVIGAMQTGDCGLGYCNLANANARLAGFGGEVTVSVVPSPFVAGGLLSYSVPGVSGCRGVEFTIYDSGGRLIRTLVDRRMASGRYSITWDGRDDRGCPSPAGMYYCQLRIESHRTIRPVLLVR